MADVGFLLSCGSPGNVNCHVPPTHHDNLTAKLHPVAKVHIQQEIHRPKDSIVFHSRYLKVAASVGADSHEDSLVPFLLQVSDREIPAHSSIESQLHAKAQDGVDLEPDQLAREPVFGDAKPQHPAGNRL